MGNEHRRRATDGDEEDVHYARSLLVLSRRYVRFVKRKTNKRERREAREQVHRDH